MDHLLSIFSSRLQSRGSNNANSENNNGTATTITATSTTTNNNNNNNNNITMPAPVYISGLSYPNDAYASCVNLITETLPKYSREGEDLEMGILPTYTQATKGASRNKDKNLRRRCRKEPALALLFVFVCFILAGAIWASTKTSRVDGSHKG
ncbi:hypothetical protein BJX66DRAFT_337381 [Aspergillus keveii]|uniref:Uncharacterized protein n=1 Tax=Aspergillus keveii TaxID=714993 RepID=A0ABR4G7G8_9EURO